MKGGVAVALALAVAVDAPDPRRHLRLLRGRGDRGALQRAQAPGRDPPGPAGRRLRRAHGALRRRRRGRLPGHPARRDPPDRPARPQRPLVAGRATRSTPRPTSWRGWRSTSRARVVIDGLEYREGLNAVGISRGRGRQRHPGRVRRHRQLPVRPVADARAGRARTSGRSSRASTSRIVDVAAGALPGPVPAGGAGVPRGDRAAPRARSSAGPTSRGSPPWGSPRSTTARATRRWRTRARSTCRRARCARPSRSCAPGSWHRSRARPVGLDAAIAAGWSQAPVEHAASRRRREALPSS